jgi:HK97 family phage portal protein
VAWFRRKRVTDDAPVGEQRSTFAPISLQQYLMAYPSSASGVLVTTETALRDAAVAACVRVLKTSITMLPVDEVIVQGKTRRPVAASQIVRRPSGRLSQRQWLAQIADSLVTGGNAYGLVVAADSAGRPTQIETIAPKDVHWSTIGELTPYVDNKPMRVWPTGDLVHIPATAFLRAGYPVADSPVELARESIGTSLAAERFGAQFFGDGAHPSSIVRSDQELTAEAAKAIKNAVVGAMVGREPAVLGSGLEYEQIQVDPKDSQFIDLMRFEVEQACRFFGVPPSMAYAAVSGQSITYANVSESDLMFLKYSLSSWLLDIEDAWSAFLTAPRVVKFNTAALLRMDATGRHSLYKTRLESKTTTVNEIRALEDEEPFVGDEFDEPGIPGGSSLPPPPPPPEDPDE